MQSVEMKDIDAVGLELVERVVEARTDEGRERVIVHLVMPGDLRESCLVVIAGVLIAAPGIDSETSGPGVVFDRSLAKGKKTFASVDPELDKDRRFQERDEVIGEMEMAGPGADSINTRFEVARG
jgi:hypothetical protein